MTHAQDAEVAAATAAALLPLGASLLFDAINVIINAIVRGSGRQGRLLPPDPCWCLARRPVPTAGSRWARAWAC